MCLVIGLHRGQKNRPLSSNARIVQNGSCRHELTIVSTRVLTPSRAVIWVAFLNPVATALFKLHGAGPLGKGTIDPAIVDVAVIVRALAGAIAWNLLTWWRGLPASSSHALAGGLIGARVSKASQDNLGWSTIRATAAFILIGMATMRPTRGTCSALSPCRRIARFIPLLVMGQNLRPGGHARTRLPTKENGQGTLRPWLRWPALASPRPEPGKTRSKAG